MHTLTAHRDIDADPQIIIDTILNIAELADWNPALISTRTTDSTARIGHAYPVSTRVPGRATLTYTAADPHGVAWRLDVSGGTEVGEWDVRRLDVRTRVTHTMTHSGALFAVMRNAMREVPTWRLDRLQVRAEARSRTA